MKLKLPGGCRRLGVGLREQQIRNRTHNDEYGDEHSTDEQQHRVATDFD